MGVIRVARVVAAVDAGRIVNPDGVINQVEVVLLDQPGERFLGVGEGSQGPAAAAIANAVANATGKRLRALPFTPERVKRPLA